MPRVEDIMQRDVITVPPNAPIADLIQTLQECGISGAPVVDEQEILVGVVSFRDVLRLAWDMEKSPEAMRWGLNIPGPPRESGFIDSPEEGEFYAYYVTPGGGFVDVRDRIREAPSEVFGGYKVEDLMTPTPFTIGPDAPLAELARLLRDRKVHRALVTREGKLVGIVTTTDLLDVVARAGAVEVA
jgi:CBS domain-containing protein